LWHPTVRAGLWRLPAAPLTLAVGRLDAEHTKNVLEISIFYGVTNIEKSVSELSIFHCVINVEENVSELSILYCVINVEEISPRYAYSII